jgi:hypothetical protein
VTYIHKYRLEVKDVWEVAMPGGAQILCVQMQDGSPHLWARVDPKRKVEKRIFRIIGTGHPMEDYGKLTYVGTVQSDYQSGFVWHIFESK